MDPGGYREMAAKARQSSAAASDPELKLDLQDIARKYDGLAAEVAGRGTKRPSDPA
jgi:hypothetical protein